MTKNSVKINLLSLFSGIGAFEKGLQNNKIDFNIVGYSDIDKYASKAYAKLYNVSEALNLGDVTEIDTTNLSKVDLVTYGFPCQPFSSAGLKQGFDDYLKRGLLFFDALKIIKEVHPYICIAENVHNLKNFTTEFNAMLNELSKLGYYNQVLSVNSKEYGSPQNRDRIFIISTLEQLPIISLKKSNIKLNDLIIDYNNVDSKNYIINPKYEQYCNNIEDIAILEDFYASRPIRVYTEYAPALRASRHGLKVVQNHKIRFLTPEEGFRLMGFTSEDYKLLSKDLSKTQLWKLLGNSIDVKITTQLFKILFHDLVSLIFPKL